MKNIKVRFTMQSSPYCSVPELSRNSIFVTSNELKKAHHIFSSWHLNQTSLRKSIFKLNYMKPHNVFYVVHDNVPNHFSWTQDSVYNFPWGWSVTMLRNISLEVIKNWCQRKCSPLFTATVFKATQLFFNENNVSANLLSDWLGVGHVLAKAHFTHPDKKKVRVQNWHPITRLWIIGWLQIISLHNAKPIKEQICQKTFTLQR